MKVHELKTWPEFYKAVCSGEKPFEIRKDDRGFQAGHFLLLKEWVPDGRGYTGREATFFVTYFLSGKSGLNPGVVCMGLAPHIKAPRNMSKKWLAARTKIELLQLAERWESWCCRGEMIREELQRKGMQEKEAVGML